GRLGKSLSTWGSAHVFTPHEAGEDRRGAQGRRLFPRPPEDPIMMLAEQGIELANLELLDADLEAVAGGLEKLFGNLSNSATNTELPGTVPKPKPTPFTMGPLKMGKFGGNNKSTATIQDRPR